MVYLLSLLYLLSYSDHFHLLYILHNFRCPISRASAGILSLSQLSSSLIFLITLPTELFIDHPLRALHFHSLFSLTIHSFPYSIFTNFITHVCHSGLLYTPHLTHYSLLYKPQVASHWCNLLRSLIPSSSDWSHSSYSLWSNISHDVLPQSSLSLSSHNFISSLILTHDQHSYFPLSIVQPHAG